MCGKWQRLFQLQPIEWVKGKVIGSGSFGTVHLAMDNATGSLFVAKSATSESGILSLKNEANILDNLDSPHIIKCIGKDFSLARNGEKKQTLFLEYMAGGSLSDVAEKFGGTLNERVIRLYTREILVGLKYLHQNGIVHSDVKCKNVLLGLSGNIKLADFGAAKKIYDNKSVKTSLKSWDSCLGGTPLWMAPEVLRNEGLDFSSDIWSLGCTVIEMATGKPGWHIDRSNPMDEILKISRGDRVPQFPVDFSEEGIDFLEKCLQTDPRKRWTSQALLDHPFVDVRPGNVFSRKAADAISPSSVLEVGSYDSDDSSDDESWEGSTPFSGRLMKVVAIDASERDFESSGDWITVRKR